MCDQPRCHLAIETLNYLRRRPARSTRLTRLYTHGKGVDVSQCWYTLSPGELNVPLAFFSKAAVFLARALVEHFSQIGCEIAMLPNWILGTFLGGQVVLAKVSVAGC